VQTGIARSDGNDIHFEVEGQGPPMVLVHGWGSDTEHGWRDTGWIDVLQPHRTLISIDVRGHGRSSKPHEPSAYTYAAMSRDVIAVLDHLDVDEADYLGYSMGAFMGAWLAGHKSDRFSSMILGGIGNETDQSAAVAQLIARALREPNAADVSDALGRAYRAYAQANPNNDLEALAVSALVMWPDGYPLRLGGKGLAEVDIPVLIVNGEFDHPYVDSADHLAEAIPGARHARIAGSDHLTAVTHPEFKALVEAFLLDP
jgi:pimeloyl-ACP methyl ester carboxylesterase